MSSAARRKKQRKDVVATQSAALSKALARVMEASGYYVTPTQRMKRVERAENDRRIEARRFYLEPTRSDPNGFERIIGESNLMSINYFDRGRRAAAAVCRITVPSAAGSWSGTGFLVGPRLLLTNNHVLSNPEEANQAEAEFGYEHDLDGVLAAPVQFNLCPHELFYTSVDLDITFVAVAAFSEHSVPLSRFGRLPLVPVTGKAINGEWVTIIQHPDGGPKQIAIRASQMIELDQSVARGIDLETFTHYSTDTEPGSSGAPVLNDQWQVLALHHKAVPAPSTSSADEEPVFIANEGIRISAIFGHLESKRFIDAQAKLVLDRLETSLGMPPSTTPAWAASEFEADRAPLKVERWEKIKGYDAKFIKGVTVDLRTVIASALKKRIVAPLLDGSGYILTYNHFSIAIHEDRKFPLVTAVNIDGSRLIRLPERKNTWRQDARLDGRYQPNGKFYERSKGNDKVQFSRGHQVRYIDPCWGKDQAEAARGAEDSFHYTNAAPQVQTYNDTDWGNLEDYLLDKAQVAEKRMTVFTGPIFRKNDPWYGKGREGGPWRIPLSFWKVAFFEKTPRRIVAAAFMIGQTQYVEALYEEKVFTGLKPYTPEEIRESKIQTTIPTIEKLTGLDFSPLRQYDAHNALESTRRTRWIVELDDIVI